MEYVHCSYCGSGDAEIVFRGGDRWYKLPGHFTMRRCRQCGLIYLSPRPSRDEIGHYYPEQYAPYEPDAKGDLLSRLGHRYDLFKKVNLIQSRVPEGVSVLDIGCGSGQFLQALAQEGWKVHGVETNAQAAAYAKSHLEVDVFPGELEEAGFPDASFDLVTMWHVLEHVHEPRALLREAARVTRKSGTLFLAVPDPDSLEATLFGRSWAGWDVPRHLHVFPRHLLYRLLSETGWEVEETVYTSGRLWLFNLSLEHWLEARETKPILRDSIMRIARSLPARILTLPYFVALERLQAGSIMGIFAGRK